MKSNEPRRTFLQHALTAAGIAVSATTLASMLASCETDESMPTPPDDTTGIKIKISDYPRLTGAGTITSELVSGLNNDRKVFVSQIDVDKFAVFSTVCTHDGCPVQLPDLTANCVCPCHGSAFSAIDGAVKKGPATSNLKTFASTFNASTGILSVEP